MRIAVSPIAAHVPAKRCPDGFRVDGGKSGRGCQDLPKRYLHALRLEHAPLGRLENPIESITEGLQGKQGLAHIPAFAIAARKSLSQPPLMPKKQPKTKTVTAEIVEADDSSVIEALTAEEKQELGRCEKVIKRGWDTFVDVGKALATIQRSRLYRDKHQTFEAYCRVRWQYGKSHAHRLIGAAEVVEHLSPIGDKMPRPLNEAQVRPLIGLDPEDQLKAWQAAVEQAAGKSVTARLVRKAAEAFMPPRPKRRRRTASRRSNLSDFTLESIDEALSALSQNDVEKARKTLEELRAKISVVA